MLTDNEYEQNFKFISRDASVFDAYDWFLNHINSKGFNLDQLFITHSGKKNEKLLGLITIVNIANEKYVNLFSSLFFASKLLQ